MAEEKDPRVVVRFPKEEWKSLDNRRHKEDTTFQAIGEQLFLYWVGHGLPDPKANPPGGTESDFSTVGSLANKQEKSKLNPHDKAIKRIGDLLLIVPPNILPAIEEYFAKVAQGIIDLPLHGSVHHGKPDSNEPPFQEMEDKPGVVADVSKKSKKAG